MIFFSEVRDLYAEICDIGLKNSFLIYSPISLCFNKRIIIGKEGIFTIFEANPQDIWNAVNGHTL